MKFSTGKPEGFRQRLRCMLNARRTKFFMRVSFFYIAIMIGSQQFLLAHESNGQGLDKRVTIGADNETLASIVQKLKAQTDLSFVFPPEDKIEYSGITFKPSNRTVKEVLNLALDGKNLAYALQDLTVIIYETTFEQKQNKSKLEDTPSLPNSVFRVVLSVTGTVRDASTQAPLAGVNIIVKGTTKGATTDTDGKFIIEAEDNDLLVFSFIGFKTFEAPINGRNIIDISLEEDVEALKEVVVNAGYWNVKDREQTGNIDRITADQIQNQPVSNPLQAMIGRVSGLYIQQQSGVPGSNFTVQLRGRNSIGNGNDPLYIIDGVPFISKPLTSGTTSGSIIGFSGMSPLNSINPADIESIEVLKDADATAIYGSRGANGVILITTKNGKSGKVKLDINFYAGASKVTRMMDLMNTTQYVQMRREALANDEVSPTASNAKDLLLWDTTRYTDWQKYFIGGVARTNNLQGSISGGNSETQFLFNVGYEKQGTVFPGDLSANKISSRLSVTHNSVDRKFSASFAFNYGVNSSNLIATDFTRTALTLAPNSPRLYNDDGKLNWENSTWTNPLSALEQKYKSRTNNLIGNGILSYKIFEELEARISLGYNDIRLSDRQTTPSTYYDPAYQATAEYAEVYFNNSNSQSWIIEPQINYNKTFGKSQVKVLVGTTFQEQTREQFVQYGAGFSSDALIENIRAASYLSILDYTNPEYRYNAVFGRVNYSWDEKYLFNFTARRDGSSRFGPDKQFANFGALGAAWIFSNERFMEGSFFSFGKLRGSIGSSGNDQISDYGYLDTYRPGATYQGSIGLRPTRLFNADYSWEVNKKIEGGIELGFLRDRISLSLSYYRNRSSSQLVNYPLARTTGFSAIQKNLAATVENTGVEIELTSSNIIKGSFSWSTTFNMTIPKNKLVSFPNLETSSYASLYSLGEPLTIVKKFKNLGVDTQTGVYLIEDMNNDGSISFADPLAVTRFGQKYYGGLNNSHAYKNWHLDIFIQFVKQTGENYYGSIGILPGFPFNQPASVLDNRWKNPGDEATVQRLSSGFNSDAVNAFSRYAFSDATVADASFIRLKNVSLSYQFPSTWTKGIKSRLYVQGQNLFTITNYFGLDPENYNAARLPMLRTYSAGVQLTF
jgi:TonB-linked SusC/RagA family outer membrane protein